MPGHTVRNICCQVSHYLTFKILFLLSGNFPFKDFVTKYNGVSHLIMGRSINNCANLFNRDKSTAQDVTCWNHNGVPAHIDSIQVTDTHCSEEPLSVAH